MRYGRNHIDKFDFLEAFPTARNQAFKAEIVKNSFAATGLVPYDPNRVISKLRIQLHTPTPPPSRGSQSSAWEPKTPLNYKQLQKQASSIKKLIQRRSRSTSPLNSAIDQVIKACQEKMQETALLAHEVKLLRTSHEKIKRNEARSKLQIAAPEGLSVAEIAELAQKARNDQIQPPIDQSTGQLGAQERRFRAPPKCSHCGIHGHKRTHCPNLIK